MMRVKAAILRRYDITDETYCQRFRGVSKSMVESHRDVSIRLENLANKWLKGLTTVEQVKEAIVLQDSTGFSPFELSAWSLGARTIGHPKGVMAGTKEVQ